MLARWDLFSYPHKDKEAVRTLVGLLRDAGLSVWWDESQILVFESIQQRIEEGLAQSRAVLAYYSRNYAVSRPCQWELTAAYLCNQGERVLVFNPEPNDAHVVPRALLRRRYVSYGSCNCCS